MISMECGGAEVAWLFVIIHFHFEMGFSQHVTGFMLHLDCDLFLAPSLL